MFDVTSRESFVNISKWLNEIKLNTSSNTVMILLGNKIDCKDDRKVSEEEAR